MPLLSASEQNRLTCTKSARKQHEYLVSRALMRQALQERFEMPASIWQFKENGKLPEIRQLPKGWHYSLSHSKGLIAFALAQTPVGIDLEWTEKYRSNEALASITNPEDLATLRMLPNLAPDQWFYTAWCLKEAWFKAHPDHQQSAVPSIDLEAILRSGWSVATTEFAQHRLVLVTAEPATFSCHFSRPFSGSSRLSLPVSSLLYEDQSICIAPSVSAG